MILFSSVPPNSNGFEKRWDEHPHFEVGNGAPEGVEDGMEYILGAAGRITDPGGIRGTELI
jgi:hypothetical protein